MKKMKNEGTIERVLQSIISVSFLLVAIFWVEGKLQLLFIALSVMVATFAAIGFCPAYKILGINRYKKGK